jgi:glycosyltransferase involved in cell wall biosynthesis
MDEDVLSLSIVVPAYNEEEALSLLIPRIQRAVDPLNIKYEVIIIDDGSQDDTYGLACRLTSKDTPIKAVKLSRNFGKESALLAGLSVASGKAVITMDADLQHPPELIPEFIDRWRKGAKIVHGVKSEGSYASGIDNVCSGAFNWIMCKCIGMNIKDSSDFKLLDQDIVKHIVHNISETTRFYRGLVEWMGHENETVLFTVAPRAAGQTKWPVLRLSGLALTAILSFTSAPLRMVTVMGVLTLILALVIGSEALWGWTVGQTVSGFSTVIGTLLFVGSFVMISLGIIGEYVGKIYEEVKSRPSYFIEERSWDD